MCTIWRQTLLLNKLVDVSPLPLTLLLSLPTTSHQTSGAAPSDCLHSLRHAAQTSYWIYTTLGLLTCSHSSHTHIWSPTRIIWSPTRIIWSHTHISGPTHTLSDPTHVLSNPTHVSVTQPRFYTPLSITQKQTHACNYFSSTMTTTNPLTQMSSLVVIPDLLVRVHEADPGVDLPGPQLAPDDMVSQCQNVGCSQGRPVRLEHGGTTQAWRDRQTRLREHMTKFQTHSTTSKFSVKTTQIFSTQTYILSKLCYNTTG